MINLASMNSNNRPQKGLFYGYVIVIATMVIMMVGFGAFFSFGIFFKPVLNEFGWNRALTSGAYSLCIIVQGVLGIIAGALSDRFGPKILLTFAGIVAGLGYILTSQVSEVWHFYVLQGLVVGIGLSGTIVIINATIARWFIAKRSLMTGLVLAGTGIGSLLMPLLADWLISAYDWRLTYVIIGSAILIVLVICAQFVRHDPAEMGLAPYAEGMQQKQVLQYGAQELSFKEAIITRQFWILFAIFFCLGFYRLTIMTHLVPHITDLGISAAIAAAILATTGGTNVAGRIAMGILADKIGNRRNIILCFVLMSAAGLWLVSAKEVWVLYLFAVVFGFFHAGAGSSEAPIIASLFGLKSLGSIFGGIALGLTIGGSIGPVLAGYIFDTTGSYQPAFLLCTAMGVIAVILTILLKPTKTKGQDMSLKRKF